MTLKDMKEKIYRLIEERNDNIEPAEEVAEEEEESEEEATEEETTENIDLTDDPDYQKKINDCINIVQNELARIKPIHAMTTYNTETSQTENVYTYGSDVRQVYKVVGCDYDVIGKQIIFDEDYKGEVKIYYYKYPTEIAEDEDDDTYVFELDQDALEVMPFGVAGDMLKSDPSTNYGAYYSTRYNELKQMLDPRNTAGLITIEDGVDL